MTADALLCNSHPALVQLLSECAQIFTSMRPEQLPEAEVKLAEVARLLDTLPVQERSSLVARLSACRQLAESANRFWERRAAVAAIKRDACLASDQQTSILA